MHTYKQCCLSAPLDKPTTADHGNKKHAPAAAVVMGRLTKSNGDICEWLLSASGDWTSSTRQGQRGNGSTRVTLDRRLPTGVAWDQCRRQHDGRLPCMAGLPSTGVL